MKAKIKEYIVYILKNNPTAIMFENNQIHFQSTDVVWMSEIAGHEKTSVTSLFAAKIQGRGIRYLLSWY